MVAEYINDSIGDDRIWRSTDRGATWTLMTRTKHPTEPDGTPTVTGKGDLDHITDLMIHPTDGNQVFAGDFLGVQWTADIGVNADWYLLQAGWEETCVLALQSAPGGAPLLSGVADSPNGFVHDDPAVRPSPADKLENPNYISTSGLDFSEATSGGSTVWARVGYRGFTDSYGIDPKVNGGITAAPMGEPPGRSWPRTSLASPPGTPPVTRWKPCPA